MAGKGQTHRACLLGSYLREIHTAFVALLPGQRFSDTAFAHELCHAYFKDQDHEVCDSNKPVVVKANNFLRSLGL